MFVWRPKAEPRQVFYGTPGKVFHARFLCCATFPSTKHFGRFRFSPLSPCFPPPIWRWRAPAAAPLPPGSQPPIFEAPPAKIASLMSCQLPTWCDTILTFPTKCPNRTAVPTCDCLDRGLARYSAGRSSSSDFLPNLKVNELFFCAQCMFCHSKVGRTTQQRITKVFTSHSVILF